MYNIHIMMAGHP